MVGMAYVSGNAVDFHCSKGYSASMELEELRTKREYEVPLGTSHVPCRYFYGCHNLVRVDIPNTVEYIGVEAFKECGNEYKPFMLHGFDNAAYVDDRAFEGACIVSCKFGEQHGKALTMGDGVFEAARICRVDIGEYVCIIPRRMFAGAKLENLWIHGKHIEIEEEAFMSAFGSDLSFVAHKAIRLGVRAFAGCWEMRKIKLSSRLRVIAEGAFQNCVRLRTVEMQHAKSLVIISKDAFKGSLRLDTVCFSEATEIIEEGAFEHTGLRSVQLPASLRVLGEKAFGQNNALLSRADIMRFTGELPEAIRTVLRTGYSKLSFAKASKLGCVAEVTTLDDMFYTLGLVLGSTDLMTASSLVRGATVLRIPQRIIMQYNALVRQLNK